MRNIRVSLRIGSGVMWAAALMACGSDGAREILQSGESAVHGVPSAPVDTVHTGVGRIAGCTAEWIGGSYAILAAHCVAETAQGCDRPRVALGILQDAALANAAGITVGSAPVGGGPLQVSLVARSTLVRGMCASNWLKSVADPGSILSDPTKNCP